VQSFMNFDSAHPLAELSCFDRKGQRRRFEVRIEPEATLGLRKWSFLVRPVYPPDESGEIYYAGVREIEEGLVQLEATNNSLPDRYHHCCITCALVPVIASHLKACVRSSKNPRQLDRSLVGELDEMRSPAAEKVWRRMVTDRGARYIHEEDRFFFDYRGD
jgi:hypothetical protein